MNDANYRKNDGESDVNLDSKEKSFNKSGNPIDAVGFLHEAHDDRFQNKLRRLLEERSPNLKQWNQNNFFDNSFPLLS